MQPARLEVSRLSCGFGARSVVDDASLSIRPGERLALLGGNGSGKTTLLRALLGLHPLGRGDLRLDGQAPGNWSHWRRRIAYIPQRQHQGRFPLRVGELIASASREVGTGAIAAAAQAAGVSTLLERPLSGLSGGQLQRAWLARTFACVWVGAGLLLADEPTAALDLAGRADLGVLLTSLPVSALIVTHDPALAARCDRVLEVADGKLRERLA